MLDGWRAVAIAMVIFEHAQFAVFYHAGSLWMRTGEHGVTIFFVLSGYLITSRLIAHPINLRHFYTRRFFRLLPVAWAYLAFLFLLRLHTGLKFITTRDALGCLFFYRNFMELLSPVSTSHFWSLSMEEQFYLTWPVLLFFLGVRRCRWIAVAGIVACALWRWFHWSYYDHIWRGDSTFVRADALLVGCLLALCWSQTQHLKSHAWLSVPCIFWLVYCVGHFSNLPPLSESIAIAVMIALSVLWRVPCPRPVAFVGRISYSIYVWQMIFLIPEAHFPLLARLLCIATFSLLSYYGIERPFSKVGYRLSNVRPSLQESGAFSVA